MTEVTSVIRDSKESICKAEPDLAPPEKKKKIERSNDEKEKLEARLIGVLSCVICFDLPAGSIYQVSFESCIMIYNTRYARFFCHFCIEK
jgi:hypothetical protein